MSMWVRIGLAKKKYTWAGHPQCTPWHERWLSLFQLAETCRYSQCFVSIGVSNRGGNPPTTPNPSHRSRQHAENASIHKKHTVIYWLRLGNNLSFQSLGIQQVDAQLMLKCQSTSCLNITGLKEESTGTIRKTQNTNKTLGFPWFPFMFFPSSRSGIWGTIRAYCLTLTQHAEIN